jgi:penicillin-binding protein 1C
MNAMQRAVATRGLAVCLALAPALGLQATAQAQGLPSFDAVRAAHRASDSVLLDRHSQPLQTLRTDPSVRRGAWLPLVEVSPALRTALVLSEDRRFWQHGGVDWQALAASAWANAWNTRTRGASTLTMQLAGLLDEDLARPAAGRSPAQKLGQILRAQQLEARWSKVQILEAYLNRVPLRGELVGVAAAAPVLFGKQASGLDAAESAVLAAMLRGPNAAPDVLERRACEVLRQQQLACTGLGTTLAQALARRPGALGPAGAEQLAPHFARALQQAGRFNSGGSSVVTTTLDAATQRVAWQALRQQLAELRGHNVEDGAVLVLDNASGEVLAWVGSSGTASQAAEVDAVQARRQPGSTIKPFVYALALQQRLVTASSRIDDSPLQLAAGAGLYQPQNYDHAYRGAVSVRTALASSLNVPAVRVAAMLGPEAVFAQLNRAGLRLSQTAGYHGHALALGSADVTLLDLTNAYRALARGGRWSPVQLQPGVAVPGGTERQLVEPGVAWLVADMLADPAARAITFGLDSPLVTRGWAAVKTGTSKDMRDNWCIGFTQRFTVGVWVGNASGAPMHGVSGVAGAAPVWRALVAQLHAAQASRAPAAPAGLVAQHGEWYLPGTAPALATALASAAPAGRFGIASPRDGSVVVLDPDIPMAAQRMVFEGAAGEWFVSGRSVGRGSSVRWLPQPGRHVLERRSGNSNAVDRVTFEVRAAQWPPSSLRSRPPEGTQSAVGRPGGGLAQPRATPTKT